MSEPQLNIRRLTPRPVSERVDAEQPRTHTSDKRETALPEMFRVLETATFNYAKAGRFAMRAFAASVALALVLWLGMKAVALGKQVLNHGVAKMAAVFHRDAAPAGMPDKRSTTGSAIRSEPQALQHPLEWIRSEAAKHAATQLGESFGSGMAAWGVRSNTWAEGWSRSPDGYVRPGQLALFQPTLNYADYRMDFFAAIESKSLSWVVRGRDTENYYAMKLTLVKPGLRPVLSMAHYPVVHGKPGRAVELPLSVIVQNNMPYHVSVSVQGSHYTVWLEGEEIDSWFDDTLPAGGIGFSSDSGARARVYWVKVSKNDDWFGRLCSHVAAGADSLPATPVPLPGRGHHS